MAFYVYNLAFLLCLSVSSDVVSLFFGFFLFPPSSTAGFPPRNRRAISPSRYLNQDPPSVATNRWARVRGGQRDAENGAR
jgi:hypothetical protein